jgi:flagellar protein FlaJ
VAATLVAAAAFTALAIVLGFLLRAPLGNEMALLLGGAIIVAGTAGFYATFSLLPSSRAGERGRAIDLSLGPAMNFVAALSCAEVPVDAIFRELADQEPYGEVAAEAAWIVRDCDGLGVDILSAIRAEARRSPSVRFQEFLQGVVTTAESGGELRPYFLAQAERFEREGTALVQGQLERLGIFAEAYVAVAVAFPLFLLVLLTVFTLIEGTSSGLVLLVWLTALVIIPAAEIGFAAIFRTYREGL